MSWGEWLLQLATVGVLAAALPYVLRLQRQLSAIRRDHGALEGGAAGLQEATRQAEAASLRLRASAETAGRQVTDRIAAAEGLRDDLRYLVERAESVADRLERQLRQSRPAALPDAPASAAAAPAADTAQSQAERDLMRALRASR